MSLSSFLCTQLNGFRYFYLTWIILLTINHLFVLSQVVTSIAIKHYFIHWMKGMNSIITPVKYFQVLTNNSIQHYSFICTQLNCSKYWYASQTHQIKHLSFVYTHMKKWSKSSIWPIHRTLSGTTILSQSGLGSNGNDGILSIFPKALRLELHHQIV